VAYRMIVLQTANDPLILCARAARKLPQDAVHRDLDLHAPYISA
jgi:hypothetical protein